MISTLAKAAASMNGQLQGADRAFAGISTDTRTLREGVAAPQLQNPFNEQLRRPVRESDREEVAGSCNVCPAITRHRQDLRGQG